MKPFFKRLKRNIKNCILCIKYPFLYPRNRWDNRYHHSVSWANDIEYKLYNKAYTEVGLHAKYLKEGSDGVEMYKVVFDDFTYLLKDNEIFVYSENGLVDNYKPYIGEDFKIVGLKKQTNSFTHKTYIVYYVERNEPNDVNYGFRSHTFKLTTSKFYSYLYKIYKFVNYKIFNKLFFVPTYIELDALEYGWRKAFGEDICKEIKQALLNKGGRKLLYSYRITQIKEKWGYLHWYDAWTFDELNAIKGKYAQLSKKVCISCGKPSTHMTTGWISPYCDDCDPNWKKEEKE